MTDRIPQNSWVLYLDTVDKATADIKEVLDGKPMGQLLSPDDLSLPPQLQNALASACR
jgi:hypothetical protein